MEENLKKFAMPLISVVLAVVVAIVLPANMDEIADSATYKDGDHNLDFIVGISPAEIGTNSEGIIDCDRNNGDNSPLCGTAKFPGVLPVITISPYIVIVGLFVNVFANVVLWAFRDYQDGVEKNLGLITGAVWATVISLIVLIVIPILFQLLEDAILNGSLGATPLLKLTPFILVVGAFVVGALSTGWVNHGTGRAIN